MESPGHLQPNHSNGGICPTPKSHLGGGGHGLVTPSFSQWENLCFLVGPRNTAKCTPAQGSGVARVQSLAVGQEGYGSSGLRPKEGMELLGKGHPKAGAAA